MSHVASTLYKSVFSANGGKKWCSRIGSNSSTPSLVKTEFPVRVSCGTHPSEDAAAHARDVAAYLIARADAQHATKPAFVPQCLDLWNAQAAAALDAASPTPAAAVAALKAKIAVWKEAGEHKFTSGTSSFRGVSFHTTQKLWSVRIRNPATGKLENPLSLKEGERLAQVRCAVAYDRTALVYHGEDARPNMHAETYDAVGEEEAVREAARLVVAKRGLLKGLQHHADAAELAEARRTAPPPAAAPAGGPRAPKRARRAAPPAAAGAAGAAGQEGGGGAEEGGGGSEDGDWSDPDSEEPAGPWFQDAAAADAEAARRLAAGETLAPAALDAAATADAVWWAAQQGTALPGDGLPADAAARAALLDPAAPIDAGLLCRALQWEEAGRPDDLLPSAEEAACEGPKAAALGALLAADAPDDDAHLGLRRGGHDPRRLRVGANWPPPIRAMLLAGGYITPEGETLKTFPTWPDDAAAGGPLAAALAAAEPARAAAAALAEPPEPPGLAKFYLPDGLAASASHMLYEIGVHKRDLRQRAAREEARLRDATGAPRPGSVRKAFLDIAASFDERLDASFGDPRIADWMKVNMGRLAALQQEPEMRLLSAPPRAGGAPLDAANLLGPRPLFDFSRYEPIEMFRRASERLCPFGDTAADLADERYLRAKRLERLGAPAAEVEAARTGRHAPLGATLLDPQIQGSPEAWAAFKEAADKVAALEPGRWAPAPGDAATAARELPARLHAAERTLKRAFGDDASAPAEPVELDVAVPCLREAFRGYRLGVPPTAEETATALRLDRAEGEAVQARLDEMHEATAARVADVVASCHASTDRLEAAGARFDLEVREAHWEEQVVLAVQLNYEEWLLDILGEDWRAIVAEAAESGKGVFGPHRAPPDLKDPLATLGFYDPSYRRSLSAAQCELVARQEASLRLGTGGEEVLLALRRQWGPTVAWEARRAAVAEMAGYMAAAREAEEDEEFEAAERERAAAPAGEAEDGWCPVAAVPFP